MTKSADRQQAVKLGNDRDRYARPGGTVADELHIPLVFGGWIVRR